MPEGRARRTACQNRFKRAFYLSKPRDAFVAGEPFVSYALSTPGGNLNGKNDEARDEDDRN
jgi:hypothetical protein